MKETWNFIYESLTEEESKELAMYIGMIELGLDVNEISFSRIVKISYEYFNLVNNPDLINFN